MRARLGVVLAFVVACAEDGEDGRDGTRIGVEELPAGSAECRNGGLLLTIGQEEQVVCNGEDGLDGLPGKDGTSVQGYQPTLSVLCNGEVDLLNAAQPLENPAIVGTDGTKESYFQYSVVVYSNGDVQTACGVSLGTLETASGGAYYAGTSMGAANRYCQVVIDYPPAGSSGGVWQFNVNAQKTPVTTYADPDMPTAHPLNGDTVSFLPAECVVRKWNGTAWVPGAFADL